MVLMNITLCNNDCRLLTDLALAEIFNSGPSDDTHN